MRHTIIIFLLITIIFSSSCGVSRNVTRSYYYVEPFKEQQIKLYLNNDSTFRLQDEIGCNTFLFSGRYRQINDTNVTFIIFDSVTSKIDHPNLQPQNVFVISNQDSAIIYTDERIFIHLQPFISVSNKEINKINLSDITYKKIKAYFINQYGKKGFYKLWGKNGVSEEEIKKKFLSCAVD
jgi:hypothetical protein